MAGAIVPDIIYEKTMSVDEVEQSKFDEIYSILSEKWYYANDVKDLDKTLMEQAITGMSTLEKDEHTNYFNLEQATAFSKELSGSSVGLGFSYYADEDQNLVVKQVYINSPADDAGLKPGDVITKVGDLSCSSTKTKKIVKYIQESDGDTILVHFNRDGKEEMVKATPGTFDATVSVQMMDDYAYVVVSSFSSDTGSDFSQAIKKVKNEGIKKIVLDLRNNTGGYLSAAIDIASNLVPEGSVVLQEKYSDGTIEKQKTNDSYSQVKMDQIVILQNGSTASASEALIGALKDNLGDVVTTVGTTSYGKGTEQSQVSFNDGTSFKYTVAKWLTPNGTSINKKGFEPDVEIDTEDARNVSYSEFKKKDKIKPDTVDENAKALQVYLKYLGYEVDRTDEYFSQASSEALKQFQKDQGFKETGVCNYKTWNALTKKVLLELNKSGLSGDQQIQKAIEQFE